MLPNHIHFPVHSQTSVVDRLNSVIVEVVTLCAFLNQNAWWSNQTKDNQDKPRYPSSEQCHKRSLDCLDEEWRNMSPREYNEVLVEKKCFDSFPFKPRDNNEIHLQLSFSLFLKPVTQRKSGQQKDCLIDKLHKVVCVPMATGDEVMRV